MTEHSNLTAAQYKQLNQYVSKTIDLENDIKKLERAEKKTHGRLKRLFSKRGRAKQLEKRQDHLLNIRSQLAELSDLLVNAVNFAGEIDFPSHQQFFEQKQRSVNFQLHANGVDFERAASKADKHHQRAARQKGSKARIRSMAMKELPIAPDPDALRYFAEDRQHGRLGGNKAGIYAHYDSSANYAEIPLLMDAGNTGQPISALDQLADLEQALPTAANYPAPIEQPLPPADPVAALKNLKLTGTHSQYGQLPTGLHSVQNSQLQSVQAESPYGRVPGADVANTARDVKENARPAAGEGVYGSVSEVIRGKPIRSQYVKLPEFPRASPKPPTSDLAANSSLQKKDNISAANDPNIVSAPKNQC